MRRNENEAIAKAAWNSMSDQFNGWDAISQDERGTYTEFAAALSAALSEQTQPATGWLSIETAPRDGTNILVWADGYSWPEVVRYVKYEDPDIEEETGEPGYWRYSDDVFADILQIEDGEFTHWMPLPAPPSLRPAEVGSATLSSGGDHE